MDENEISKIVFESALKVHKILGPGLLESAYEECLFQELKKFDLNIEKQKALPLIYEEVKLDVGYRIDIIIENKFIVEVKSVESLNDVHLAQPLTYLRLSNCKLGLLINFNVSLLKNGVKRVINGTLQMDTTYSYSGLCEKAQCPSWLNKKYGIRRNKIFILTFYTAICGGTVPLYLLLEKKEKEGIWGFRNGTKTKS